MGIGAARLLRALVLLALPFVALIRSALYLEQGRGWPSWLAMVCAALLTSLVVFGYAAWLARRLPRGQRVRPWLWRGSLLIVACALLYALLTFSATNVVSPDVRATYTQLHPLMRVSLSTLLLIDSDLVVTDIARVPADYAVMDLPMNRESLHFEQSDGYVHAVDLRTRGRIPLRNWLLERALRGLGFDTLRHRGTADHLHVSLPKGA